MKTLIAPLLVSLGSLAWLPDAVMARGQATQQHDSAGVRIVENARPVLGLS